MLHLLFHLFHLAKADDKTLASVETRAEECIDDLAGDRRPDDLGAEAEHVHVVVLDPLVCAVRVVADRRANALELASRDRRAYAGAADEDASLCPPALDRLAELACLVGVVDADGVGVGAEVDHLMPAVRVE